MCFVEHVSKIAAIYNPVNNTHSFIFTSRFGIILECKKPSLFLQFLYA